VLVDTRHNVCSDGGLFLYNVQPKHSMLLSASHFLFIFLMKAAEFGEHSNFQCHIFVNLTKLNNSNIGVDQSKMTSWQRCTCKVITGLVDDFTVFEIMLMKSHLLHSVTDS